MMKLKVVQKSFSQEMIKELQKSLHFSKKLFFQEMISNLLRELKGEKGETNLLSRILWINLAGECSKNYQSINLLENQKNI